MCCALIAGRLAEPGLAANLAHRVAFFHPAQMKETCASKNFNLFMARRRPTDPITHTAKPEFSAMIGPDNRNQSGSKNPRLNACSARNCFLD